MNDCGNKRLMRNINFQGLDEVFYVVCDTEVCEKGNVGWI